MEKFYIVTEESTLHKEYFDYQKNCEIVRTHTNVFFKQHGIEAEQYVPGNDYLMIVPSENDINNFGHMFKKTSHDGLREFKKNSKISKAWVQYLKAIQLDILSKPYLLLYFRGYGKSRYRLFHIEDTLYSSYETASKEIQKPVGFKEIKGSEFFKVIEDYNSKIEANKKH